MGDDSGVRPEERDPERAPSDHPSFASWEPTWGLYGPLVIRVANELEPHATQEELNAQVVRSAAAGFLDLNTLDPLAALLDGLLRNRSPAQRSRAAQLWLMPASMHNEPLTPR
jgi:hypothetical protein